MDKAKLDTVRASVLEQMERADRYRLYAIIAAVMLLLFLLGSAFIAISRPW